MAHKRCFALLCSYDGGAFSGFQRQPPLVTVQGVLEEALVRLGHKGQLEGGGRTDAGVHARRQVITFRTREPVDPASLPLQLARLLPRGLAVLAATEAPFSFHARFSAVNKVYRYRVVTGPAPTQWEERFCWTLPDLRGFPEVPQVDRLDEVAMRRVLVAMTGPHDFKNLVHPNAEGKTRRLLSRAELVVRPRPAGGALYELTLTSPGFLRHQVRNIAGVAVTAGLGRLPEGQVEALLSAEGDRWRGARAPGRGLTLWDIQYKRGEDPFRPEGLGAFATLG